MLIFQKISRLIYNLKQNSNLTLLLIKQKKHENNYKIIVLQDAVGQLAKDGNWFESLDKDFNQLQSVSSLNFPFLSCKIDLYQNAGANIIQQLAYAMAHVNEYFNNYLTSTISPS